MSDINLGAKNCSENFSGTKNTKTAQETLEGQNRLFPSTAGAVTIWGQAERKIPGTRPFVSREGGGPPATFTVPGHSKTTDKMQCGNQKCLRTEGTLII
jgi:hypothetical protein